MNRLNLFRPFSAALIGTVALCGIASAQSVYRWKGEVCEANECLLAAQVSEAALPEFMARARALHSYEVPCVIAMPIADGHQPFLRWITENSLPPTA